MSCKRDSATASWSFSRLAQHLRVIRAPMAVSGNLWIALEWYRHKSLPEFDGRTAQCLVADGREKAVLAYLASIESGWAG